MDILLAYSRLDLMLLYQCREDDICFVEFLLSLRLTFLEV